METDDDSHSSSSGSSNSSSNGPTSPPQEPENESNDQPEPAGDAQRSRSSSPDSNSNSKPEATNQSSLSPARDQNISNEQQSKDDDEELELSDIDDESSKPKKADISHEDLSDISDLESNSPSPNFTDLRQKLDKQRLNGSSANESHDKSNDEDELDFEADEVREVSSDNPRKVPEVTEAVEKPAREEGETKSDDGSIESGEELEDGEVTDGDDKRPEESEPKAVCRFFTRGQCTWGMSCRFLHPGTTDKGNYTMFDMVRPIPVPQAAPIPPAYDYRNDRPPIHHMPPHAAYGHPRVPPVAESETAWERGLRTAKEMMRKASKRKEQDIDFDEKKMNLSGPPDEVEKDPYYVRGSPEPIPIASVKATPPFERLPRERPRFEYSPPPKYSRGAAAPFDEDPYGRVPRYRELPAHRMPHYEDDDLNKRRMVRSTREVIVEKADEWSDPWARKSTRRGSGGRENRGRGRERSYSSNSSYSTSNSSRSRSSSETSGSPSAARRKQQRTKEPRKPIRAKSRSASIKRRHSPPVRPRPAIEKKLASPVPTLKRKKPISPPQTRPEKSRTAHSKKKRDSSSGSGSTSGSESDSSYSSSTSDSKGKKKREKIVVERKPSSKAEVTKKRATPTKEDKKDKASSEKAAAAAKMKSTRREELLKQLKAVEDAIARKKSKIN